MFLQSIRKRLTDSVPLLLGAAVSGTILCSGCESDELELSPGEPSNLTAEQIVEKMSAATDPQGRYKSAKSYILKQSVISEKGGDKTESSLEIKYKAPSFMRYTSFKDGKAFSIVIFNGEKAWNINPDTGKNSEIPSGMRLNLVKMFADMAKPGNTLKNIFSKIDVSIVGGRGKGRMYRLVCRSDDPRIAPYVIYVGANDFLTRRFETTLYADDTKVPYISDTGNYVWMDGIRMASETIVSVGGSTDRSTVESFILNTDIPDSEFQLPVPWYIKAGEGSASSTAPAK